jgi:hypothetical protein
MHALRARLCTAASLALLCLAGNASAQAPAFGPPVAGQTIRCESVNNRSQTCSTPWRGDSRLIRQLSSTTSPCREGITWRSQRNQVWVTQGCRGEFGYAGAPPVVAPPVDTRTMRCESANHQHRICRTPWQGHSRLLRQLSSASSPCVEGTTWQSQQNQVFVDRGCRAEFAPINGGPGVVPPNHAPVRCQSTTSRNQQCATPWTGRSRLVRQLTSAKCIEGASWGTQPGQVWTSRGCGGDFLPDDGRPPHPNPGYSVTCSSSNNRLTTCNWNSRMGPPVLVEQLSTAPCVQGQGWGYDQLHGLWVNNGCRARFGVQ